MIRSLARTEAFIRTAASLVSPKTYRCGDMATLATSAVVRW